MKAAVYDWVQRRITEALDEGRELLLVEHLPVVAFPGRGHLFGAVDRVSRQDTFPNRSTQARSKHDVNMMLTWFPLRPEVRGAPNGTRSPRP